MLWSMDLLTRSGVAQSEDGAQMTLTLQRGTGRRSRTPWGHEPPRGHLLGSSDAGDVTL